MATKPGTVPTFNTGGANNAAPPGDKQIAGWLVGEQPPSSYFNWLHKLTGEWLQYLSDGAFTGAASFANAVTMAQTLGVTGLSSLGSLAVSGATALTGAVTASSTLAVSGAASLLNTLGVTGLITANAGLTAAANQHVTVSGTGDHKHGDRVAVLLGSSLLIESGSGWTTAFHTATSTSNQPGLYRPQFKTGDRIKSVTVALFGNGSADAVIGGTVVSANPLTTVSLGTQNVTNPPASWADYTVDLTDTVLGAGEVFAFTVAPNATGIQVGNVRITWDRP